MVKYKLGRVGVGWETCIYFLLKSFTPPPFEKILPPDVKQVCAIILVLFADLWKLKYNWKWIKVTKERVKNILSRWDKEFEEELREKSEFNLLFKRGELLSDFQVS